MRNIKVYELFQVDMLLYLKQKQMEYWDERSKSMHWESPDGNYTFLIKRTPNNLWSGNESEYIVTIDIQNNVGARLYTLRLTEISCITLLESLLCFTDYDHMDFDAAYSSYTIAFDPSPDQTESTLIVTREDIYGKIIENSSPRMEYEKEVDTPLAYYTPYFNEGYDEYREILFQITNYNPFYRKVVPIVSTYLSDAELEELCFIIFFEVFIDIDIPPRYMSDMEYITHRFTQQGYYETVTKEMLDYKDIH